MSARQPAVLVRACTIASSIVLLCWLSVTAITAPQEPTGLPRQPTAQRKSPENPAVADVRKAAELGDVQAQYNLAVMYDTGRGVPQDYARAVVWYRKAAEHGFVRAQYNLALMYAGGQGVPQDYAQALAWYRKAADLGDAPAQYNLGLMYEGGQGVPRDYALALSWYRKAADQRHAGAMYNLGAMYSRGQGVAQDYVEAHKWRQLAAMYASADKQKPYADSVEAVATLMTPQQIAEAHERASEWVAAFEGQAQAKAASDVDTSKQPPAAPPVITPAVTGVETSTPPRAAQQVFTSAVDLVEVETTVVDDGGRQVSGLSVSDLELTVDGSHRPIASVTYVPQTHNASDAPAHAGAAGPSQDGRLMVFAVDEGNISAGGGRGAIQAAQRLLGTLGPADRVALLAFPRGSALDFTRNHARVQTALEHVVGHAPRSHGEFGIGLSELFAFEPGAGPLDRQTQQRVILRECQRHGPGCQDELEAEAELRLHELSQRTGATAAALSALFTTLERIPGRKTVILISEGMILRPDGGDTHTTATIATQAAAARVTLYSILLGGDLIDAADSRPSPSAAQDRAFQEDGLRELTGRSGGALLRVMGKADGAFERLARELSGYYLIAFSVLPSDRDGHAHAIRLTTARHNVTIRARAQFIVPPS
jgi:VWFA-related protein